MSANGKSGHMRSRAHQRLELIRDTDPERMETIVAAMPEGEASQMRAELERLRAEVEELRGQNADLNPFTEWPVFDTPAAAREFLGEQHLRESAEARIVSEDRARNRRGLPPQWTSDPESYERRVAKIVEDLCREAVGETSKWVDNLSGAIRMRTVKMVKPDGTLIQVPVEPQINNGAGSIADPIERYKRKGYKMASPMRCALRDCWKAAATTGGRMTFGGYCSAAHVRHVEGNKLTSQLHDGENVSVFDSTVG